MDNYRSVLKTKGYLVANIVGNSMMPLLREGKDTVLIKPINRKLKKFDVVLFQRKNGRYVLHRIIKIKNDKLVICGDNRIVKDYDIKEQDLIGVMDGYYKKEKFISINAFWYKIYCNLLFLHRPIIFIKNVIYRVFRKGGNNYE